MNAGLAVGEDQRDLAAMARSFLDEHTDLTGLLGETVPDPLWTEKQLNAATELGLTALLTADGGGTHADLAVVVEQLGRTGSALPLGAVALAARLAESAGLDTGPGLCVLAAAEPGSPEITVDGASRLTGRAAFVQAAASAERLVVLARTAGGRPAVAVVDGRADGVTITPRSTLDLSRRYARVELNSVPAIGSTVFDVGPALDAVAVHAAADSLGAGARLLEMTLEHVRTREQFGRAIGSFQAVKHHCANMATALELTAATVLAATRSLDGSDEVERAIAVSSAASFAGEACSRVAGLAVQLHGGMGFTWEQPVHVFVRRIKTGELLAGTPRWHRERLIRLTERAG